MEVDSLKLFREFLKKNNKISDMEEKYLELKKKYNRLEKEHKKLQVEHSRVLFDMDAVIEHEVNVKCKKIKEKAESPECEKLLDMMEDASELINLAWLLIYDTRDMPDSEIVEKIWNAINIFYDKYEE